MRFKLFVRDLFSRVLVRNLLSLGVLQVTNYLLPIILIPFLLQVLGIENFGKVSFAQAVISYLIVIAEYGHNLIATREIATARHDLEKVSQIFSSVIVTKVLLVMAALLLLILTMQVFPKIKYENSLYFFGFTMVLGQAFLPVWLFQGMEKMQFLTYQNIISKLLVVVLIFTCIKNEADYALVLLIYGLGNLASSLISIFVAINTLKVRFIKPSGDAILTNLKSGFPVFLSSFSINSYINSNLLVLGFFASDKLIGIYSVAEKILQVFRQILGVFSQAVYPRVCQLVLVGGSSLLKFFKNVYLPFLLLILVCSVILFFISEKLSFLVMKEDSELLVRLIEIISFVPVIICLNIPFYQTLVATNKTNQYSRVIISGAVMSLLLNFFLTRSFSVTGTAFTCLVTESFITLGLILSLEKLNPKYALLKK